MDHDCGWVELLGTQVPGAVGRGHLLAEASPGGGEWHGRIESLRLVAGTESPPGGMCLIRFERGREVRLVTVEQRPAPSGEPPRWDVTGADGEVPAVLIDLAEGA